MKQKHLGVDFGPLGFAAKLALVLEGDDLSGVEHMGCCVKAGPGEWIDYPVTAQSDRAVFGEDNQLLAEVPESCCLSVVDMEILKRQHVVEAAGYQWQEHSRPAAGGGREYMVAITRSFLPMWTWQSPNVRAWGWIRNRLDCWKEATVHAVLNPAAGSAIGAQKYNEQRAAQPV